MSRKIAAHAKLIGITLFVVGTIAGFALLDYWVWSLQHPDAPVWTYFLRR